MIFLCEKIVRGWVVELFCLLKEEFLPVERVFFCTLCKFSYLRVRMN